MYIFADQRRSTVFPLVILFHFVAIVTFVVVVLGILPSIRPEDVEFSRMLNNIYCYFMVAMTIENVFVTYTICLVLRRIYSRVSDVSSSVRTTTKRKARN